MQGGQRRCIVHVGCAKSPTVTCHHLQWWLTCPLTLPCPSTASKQWMPVLLWRLSWPFSAQHLMIMAHWLNWTPALGATSVFVSSVSCNQPDSQRCLTLLVSLQAHNGGVQSRRHPQPSAAQPPHPCPPARAPAPAACLRPLQPQLPLQQHHPHHPLQHS